MHREFKMIDLTYLNGIADGNQEIIKELILIFVDQLPEFTDGLTESFALSDWPRMAALAHKAKSSVVSMGMNEIGDNDLKNLELLAKNKRINVLKELLSLNEKEEKELDSLEKNLASYPVERQEWVINHDDDHTIKQIIDKFVDACETAKLELSRIIGA
ncbi:MAG: Hpt domain-containing protein [Breznakibacter sp.]